MNFKNDEDYIDQIINGNTSAFSDLVDHYKDLVFTLAYKILKNREESEEASQDTFVKVFKSLAKFNGDSKFSTWIYKITYNTCLDRLKKNKRDRSIIYVEDYNEHQIEDIENIIEKIEVKEKNKIIKECIQLLPSEDAFLLTLFYFDDQSLKEIAEIIGSNPNNVKIKLYRSRKKLISILNLNLK